MKCNKGSTGRGQRERGSSRNGLSGDAAQKPQNPCRATGGQDSLRRMARLRGYGWQATRRMQGGKKRATGAHMERGRSTKRIMPSPPLFPKGGSCAPWQQRKALACQSAPLWAGGGGPVTDCPVTHCPVTHCPVTKHAVAPGQKRCQSRTRRFHRQEHRPDRAARQRRRSFLQTSQRFAG